ncbi:MAG: S24 family peptidase [Moraxella sp.]|nr:S24 family peptidase [Moraxella sp.]
MNEIPAHLLFENTPVDFEKQKANATTLPISQALLNKLGVSGENLAFFPFEGEAMKPTLDGKGLLLADLSDNKLRDGKIYILEINSRLLVRRVQVLLNKIILVADNPEYQNIEICGENLNHLKVHGRLRLLTRTFP